jgi:hypothetical protein
VSLSIVGQMNGYWMAEWPYWPDMCPVRSGNSFESRTSKGQDLCGFYIFVTISCILNGFYFTVYHFLTGLHARIRFKNSVLIEYRTNIYQISGLFFSGSYSVLQFIKTVSLSYLFINVFFLYMCMIWVL